MNLFKNVIGVATLIIMAQILLFSSPINSQEISPQESTKPLADESSSVESAINDLEGIAPAEQLNNVPMQADAVSSENSTQLESLKQFIDGYAAARLQNMDPSGIVVSVVLGDEQITKGYGIANIDTQQMSDENTLYRIGSISKLFVWLSVHMLADEGKLDLDADVNIYLEDITIPDTYDQPITMRHLAAHKAGFEDSLLDFLHPERDISIKQSLQRALPARVAPPGERTSYSNTGTNLAAHIVEQVSGISYYEFVQTRILQPVGLTSTTLHDMGHGLNPIELEQRTAVPHRIKEGGLKAYSEMGVKPQEPVGAVAMSASDAAIFMRMLLNETQHASGRLMSPTAFAQMTTTAFDADDKGDSMGFGFMLNSVDGLSTYGHGGATQFLSWIFMIPELEMGVFVSANMSSAEARNENMAWSIVREITGTGTLSDFLQLEGNKAQADEIAGEYLNNRRPFTGGASILGTDYTKISATEDGFVLFPGNPKKRYALIGEDVWVNYEGQRLTVIRNEDNDVIRLQVSKGSATLEPVSLLASSRLAIIGLGGVTLLCITGLLGMFRRFGTQSELPLAGKILGWVNVLTVLVWLAFVISVAALVSSLASFDISTVDDNPFPPFALTAMFMLALVVTIWTGLQLLCIYPVWVKSGWSLWRRLHFTIFTMLAIVAVLVLYNWNVIGGNFYNM